MGGAARRLVVGGLLTALAALVPAVARAQGGPPVTSGRRTLLSVTGLPLPAPIITPADFDAGFVTLGSVAFTVDAVSNNPAYSPRVTTVNVRCFAPCPASGTLPGTGLQWRRGDLATWTPLTTTLALVETRLLTVNGANDPWSNSLQFRYVLGWTTVPPTAATQFQLEFQLVVTAP